MAEWVAELSSESACRKRDLKGGSCRECVEAVNKQGAGAGERGGRLKRNYYITD